MKEGEDDVEVITHIELKDGKWTGGQYVKDMPVPGTEMNYPEDKLPMLALRWSRIDGEDYGRGHGEDYLGDLISLEGLSKSIIELAAISAKVLFLANPNGLLDPNQAATAVNGQVLQGVEGDLTVVSVQKLADMQVARSVLDEISKRLSYGFLLNSAVQRDAERVTSEEIRYMAQELETAMGGVYSLFAQEFQLPLVKLYMARLERTGELPKLPEDKVRPTIVTGLDALGRNEEVRKLDALLSGAVSLFGPQALQYVKMGGYLQAKATALGITTNTIIRTDDEVQQMQNAATQASMVSKLGPFAIREMGGGMREAAARAQESQPQNG
jgi:hypothetical protein